MIRMRPRVRLLLAPCWFWRSVRSPWRRWRWARRGVARVSFRSSTCSGSCWIADPQISPDGKQVAFVRVSVNKKHEGYDTAIWMVPTSGAEAPRALTAGPRDSTPRWAPDGQQLAFVRAPEEEGKPQPAADLPALDGRRRGAAVHQARKGAGAPQWSPDGKRLAFTSTTIAKDSEKPTPPAGDDPAAEQKARKSDVRVITRAAYRFNGAGYLDPTRHSAIWTLAVGEPDAKPSRVTRVTST